MKTKTEDKKPNPRKIQHFKYLKTGDLSPKGFDLYHLTEGVETTVRNLLEVSPGIYKDTKDCEFHQA